MEYILNFKKGRYILEKNEDSKKVTDNQETIYNFVESIKSNPVRVSFYKKYVKLYFGEKRYIVLKNYEDNKDCELYSKILSFIDDNTKIVRNVDNVNTNAFKKLSLTGAVVVCLSLVGFATKDNSADASKDIPIVSESTIISPTITPSPTIAPLPTTTPIPTPPPIVNEIKDFEDRYTESMLMNMSNRTNFIGIPLATNFNDYFCKRALECFKSDIWTFCSKYGDNFGVDPYISYSLLYGETGFEHDKTLPGGSSYNGSAVGIGQHENPNGNNSVTAFNYNTNEYETEIISMENACDLEKNIKMTIMLLQNKLNKYNGNIYVAIQSYNYGDWAMKTILNEYAKEKNMTFDEVLSNHSDTGWLKYVEHFHNNPQQYLPNWKYKTYGDPNYVNKIMGYYIGTESTNILLDGTKVTTNLITLDKTYEVKSR